MIIDFIEYDFTKIEDYAKLLKDYSLCALNTTDEMYDIDFLDEHDILTQEEFERLYNDTYKARSVELIKIQNAFREVIDFVFNIYNYSFLKELKPSERYFVFKNVTNKNNNNLYWTIYSCSSNVKINYDIHSFMSKYKDITEDDYSSYKKLASYIKNHGKLNDNKASIFGFTCNTIETACYITLVHIIENNLVIKKCKNCGKYFLPDARTTGLYCNRKQVNGKTCKEVGAVITYNEKLKTDEVTRLYRQTLSAKKMLVNRNPDIPEYLNYYNEWKKETDLLRKSVKEGKTTISEFKEWIEKTRLKKY
ncbi:MAG: DUF6076 domain-containing protein [Clostridia bacterium]